MFVKTDPLGNPVDRQHPWNQTTIPRPQKTRLRQQLHVGDVRRAGITRTNRATRSISRLILVAGQSLASGTTALAGKVDIGYVKATGHSVKIICPRPR